MRPAFERRGIPNKIPSAKRQGAIPTQSRPAPVLRIAPVPAAGKESKLSETERPKTSRVKKREELVPKRADGSGADPKSGRRLSARGKTGPGFYVKKMRTKQKKENNANGDVMEDARRIRIELEKEFNDSIPEASLRMDWLDDLDRFQRELNDNVYRSMMRANSPETAFDQAFNKVIENAKTDDDFVESGQRMVNVGFDALHAELEAEEQILKERLSLLQRIGDTLLAHQCDFKADLEYNDERDPIPTSDYSDIGRLGNRPKTAR
jgi:hypothetical protein